jgi:hypothetical protein
VIKGYEVVNGEELHQGDILTNFPIIIPSLEDLSGPSPDMIRADLEFFDVVIFTQTCDLRDAREASVVVCPHFDFKQKQKDDPALQKKGVDAEIQKGRRFRYQFLAPFEDERVTMGLRLVDFGRPFTVPKQAAMAHAKKQGARLRLMPPYREHLSQAFAICYMRVAIPDRALGLP